jgi:3-phenylpropionate/trans-cinnamate dioxygenase ferredoxin reductase subunit
MPHVVIVGAGQAGASLAAKLRALGFSGGITLFGEEPAPPYQRPPLSKKYLTGEMEKERLYLRPASFYTEHGITLRLNARASGIDPAARRVEIGGETMAYDDLVLTTGSVPRRLPAAICGDLAGVYTMRTLADADAMAPEFREGARVLIVGGGYIGLEAAAVAVGKGLKATLIEMAPRILQRVASPETSDYFRALHRAHGVDLREGAGLSRLTGEGRVASAVLSDGNEIPVDFVIVGVGIVPCTGLAEAAGILCANGIAVDEMGRTSVPHVWAAGDCASFPYRGARLRLESVQNAIDMAEAVAANLMGAEAPYRPVPWFWSDQYDAALQIAGLNTGYDRVVVRNAGAARSHWYYRGAEFLAVDAMNDARAYMVGKRLLEAGKSPAPEAVIASEDLKALLKG